MRTVTNEVWVVYKKPMKGSPDGIRAICEQREWDAMDLAKPEYYTLIQAGIENEGEAERLARGSSGAKPPRNAKQALASFPSKLQPIAAAIEMSEPEADAQSGISLAAYPISE